MSGVSSRVGARGLNPAVGFHTRPRRDTGVVGAAAIGVPTRVPHAAAAAADAVSYTHLTLPTIYSV